MRYCLYGTCYNSVGTIEATLNSIFRPDVTIVIVDSHSTDGTYEKLLTMKKDYNLTLISKRCSRGIGRDIGLKLCPENSFTSYVDLDVVYNKNFWNILESEKEGTLVWQHFGQTAYFATKDYALKSGGYRNLNSSETLEFILRTGILNSYPITIGNNMRYSETSIVGRERRYSKGIGVYLRTGRITTDNTRGQGLSFGDFLSYYGLSRFPLFLASRIMGSYRMLNSKSNIQLFLEELVEKLNDHRELGISDDCFALPLPSPFFFDLRSVMDRFREIWGSFKIYKLANSKNGWRGPVLKGKDLLIFTLNETGLRNYLEATPGMKIFPDDFETLTP